MIPVFITASVLHEGIRQEIVVDQELQVSVGDHVELHVPRQDTGAVYTLGGLPTDAVARAAPDGILVRWDPTDTDVGTHRIRVDVRLGEEGYVKTVRFVVNEHGQQLFVPGAVASCYVPNNVGTLGTFVGGGAEIVFFFYADQNNLWVPSHGRFYIDALGFGSTQPGVDPILMVAAGFDLTLERAPGRRFLLPYLGIQTGAAWQHKLGGFGWAMPLLGFYPWAARSVRVALQGGYLLPTTADQGLRGFLFMASLDVAPW